MKPHGIIFDLDGVLIDSEGLQYASYSRVLDRWDVRVSPADYARYWIAAGRGPEYAVATFGLPVSPDDLRELKHPVYHEILRERVTLMPGVVAALERFRPHFRIALATNSIRHDVDFVMDRFGLRGWFDAIVTRDDYARAKPDPDAFLTAARHLDLPGDACVVIEDAHKGVLAAHRAGIPVIAVPNEWTRENDFSLAARTVTGLDDITVAMIEELART